MTTFNIYRLEYSGYGLVAKHQLQVTAKNDTHALHLAIAELKITDSVEQRRLCARAVAYDDWYRPTKGEEFNERKIKRDDRGRKGGRH